MSSRVAPAPLVGENHAYVARSGKNGETDPVDGADRTFDADLGIGLGEPHNAEEPRLAEDQLVAFEQRREHRPHLGWWSGQQRERRAARSVDDETGCGSGREVDDLGPRKDHGLREHLLRRGRVSVTLLHRHEHLRETRIDHELEIERTRGGLARYVVVCGPESPCGDDEVPDSR